MHSVKNCAAVALLACPLSLYGQIPQEVIQPGPTIQVDVNLLLLPVVVRDAAGHAVGGLTKENFKVLDQGKARPVAKFSIESSQSISSPVQSQTASQSPTAQAAARYEVLLFDDRHLSPGDLEQARAAAAQFLTQSLPSNTLLVVLSFSGVNSGVTRNPAVLQAAMARLKVDQHAHMDEHECGYIDYFMADQIANKNNPHYTEMALEKAHSCEHGAAVQPQETQIAMMNSARRSLELGDQDALKTLLYLRDTVHTLFTLHGSRSLILVSPGFLTISQDAMNLESQIETMAANDSVVISTLDAKGLYAGELGAQLSGEGHIGAISRGDLQDEIKDVHDDEQETMELIADGTGGAFFHNNNDLAAGFKALSAALEYTYQLAIPIQDVKANGAFHSLKVELVNAGQSGLQVQARKGYFAPPQVSKKK